MARPLRTASCNRNGISTFLPSFFGVAVTPALSLTPPAIQSHWRSLGESFIERNRSRAATNGCERPPKALHFGQPETPRSTRGPLLCRMSGSARFGPKADSPPPLPGTRTEARPRKGAAWLRPCSAASLPRSSTHAALAASAGNQEAGLGSAKRGWKEDRSQETAAASPTAAARGRPPASRCARPCPVGPGCAAREGSSRTQGG